MNAANRYYHSQCFRCTHCMVDLGTKEGFNMEDNHLYCQVRCACACVCVLSTVCYRTVMVICMVLCVMAVTERLMPMSCGWRLWTTLGILSALSVGYV